MEWTREKTLCLINEYRQRRGLWDMTHDDYRKKEVKQKLLGEVSDSLGGNIAISEIEKKFHTLRTQYHREINRMKRKEPYNSKWFGFKNLQFLSSPKACRTNKGRIRSEITEDGTVTTKIEVGNGNDCSDSSPHSSSIQEEFLTLHPKGSYETITTATTVSNASRSHEFEKLIEETTKDVEDENLEMKPKIYSKVPQYSAHIEVNPDLNVSQPEIQQLAPQPMEETIETVEISPETETNILYHHTNIENSGVTTVNAQTSSIIQPTIPSRIIKIQRRDPFQDQSYYGEQQQTKRIFYSSDGQTTSVLVNPTTTASTAQPSPTTTNYITAITKVSPQHPPAQQHHQQQQQQAQTQQQQQQQPQPQNPQQQHQQTTVRSATAIRNETSNVVTGSKQQQLTQRDQFSTYGEHIANEMRGITNKEILISLKHKINTALFEAQMAELQK